jgi:hypothetical protein
MKMRTIVAAGLAATALVACSSAPTAGAYVKAGATDEQRARDQAECAGMAAASDNPRSLRLASAERESVDACMRARGYTRAVAR